MNPEEGIDLDKKPVKATAGVDDFREEIGMKIDDEKIEDAVLALLWLTLHDGRRAWKSFDWDTMVRLHHKGMIEDPVNKAKSVVLTNDGLRRAEELFGALFTRPD